MSDYDRESPPYPPTRYVTGQCSFKKERPDAVPPPDQWTTPWQHTLVAPLFVGGPADGHRDKSRPRWDLPLRIMVPVVENKGLLKVRAADEPLPTQPPIGSFTYRMTVYRDAFTVEYR